MTIGHETLSTPAAPGRPASEAPARGVSLEAFEALANLQRLTLEAGLSENLNQLIFRILNRSIGYCRYDRAALWSMSSKRPKLLGVSGNSDVNRQAPLVSEWRAVVAAIPNRDAATVIDPTALRDQSDAWDRLARRTNGLSVIWLPIAVDGRTVAALWLERWGGSRFAPGEAARLEALALAYGIAWRSVTRCSRRTLGGLATRRRVFVALAMLLLAAAMFFIRLPLRIVAPCEVVPKDPVAVTAPLNGVIDEIPVLPGRSVERGALLAAYDKRVSLEEMKVARQQVQIIKSDLQRARVQAFDDPAARAEIALLENRLAQEEIRLRMAQQRVDRLEVRAPVGGTLMFADPHEWRGRPVQVGERLMLIVDPARTKLRIWLPEHDNIRFDQSRNLTVVLGSDPSGSRTASLRFLANHSQVNGDGLACFRAEADWVDPAPDVKMGLKGTAILYGDEVPLGYWLIRRPLAAVRRFAGI
jgi:hypothetical protein